MREFEWFAHCEKCDALCDKMIFVGDGTYYPHGRCTACGETNTGIAMRRPLLLECRSGHGLYAANDNYDLCPTCNARGMWISDTPGEVERRQQLPQGLKS